MTNVTEYSPVRGFTVTKKLCVGDNYSCIEPKSVPDVVFYSPDTFSPEFKLDILSKFNADNIGRLCQTGSMIKHVGFKLYSKLTARADKKTEVRRSVMADMRRLANLFVHFQTSFAKADGVKAQPTVTDMFHRRNFDAVEEAFRTYTSGGNGEGGGKDKAGLAISLFYLMMSAAKIIRVYFLVREETATANDVAEFLEVLNFSKNVLIGGAVYASNKNRQTRLRRPQKMPLCEYLQVLRTYTIKHMESLLADPFCHWTSTEFVELRGMTCCRLTLFNARRGGEPARLQLCDWSDARKKV